MGQRIDQFCENLRQKLTMTDSGLEGLKTKIDAKKANVEQDVQRRLIPLTQAFLDVVSEQWRA